MERVDFLIAPLLLTSFWYIETEVEPSTSPVFSSFGSIWKFDNPEENQYARFTRENDLTAFRLFTFSSLIFVTVFLLVDLNREVNFFWVLVMRSGLLILNALFLSLSYLRHLSAGQIQFVLVFQIMLSYAMYFAQAFLAQMPVFFLTNVLLLFFYAGITVSGIRFRYGLCINAIVFLVFIILAENLSEPFYQSQEPNLTVNLLASIISGGFIEKQKRKEFLQFSELLKRKTELDELNQQKNRVISILSHDVASPLQSTSGLLSTFEKNQITKEELDHFMGKVRQRLDVVLSLVYSLVRWSKTQMDGFSVHRVAMEVLPALRESIVLASPMATAKSIAFTVDCPAGLSFYADREMVEIILRNLLSNAVKFTPPEKKIFIKAYPENGMCVVCVSNESDPIPDHVLEKLFTFQSRSGPGTANESGTGLGLAMSQHFAILNGGKIVLKPYTEPVNTFCLELPMN